MSDTCFVVQPIHDAGVAVLRDAGLVPVLASSSTMEAVSREIGNAIAVVTRNAGLSAAAIAAAPRLRVIGVHGIGTDPVAIDAASRRGIVVLNTPGSNVQAVAEHALALAFALAKVMVPGDRAVRDGDVGFRYRATLTELAGLTFGVVGFGGIGRATAVLARAVGMRPLVWSRGAGRARAAAAGFAVATTLDDLLGASDVVSLHLPATPGTAGLIGTRELGLMRPHALLINTARGTLVDEEALVVALRAKAIAGAGLDVVAAEPLDPGSPLCFLPNVVLTPHVAGSTRQALQRTATAVAEAVVAALAGVRPPTLVNPEVWPS